MQVQGILECLQRAGHIAYNARCYNNTAEPSLRGALIKIPSSPSAHNHCNRKSSLLALGGSTQLK